ncbi:hypothetical protein EDC04DRAFT_2673657, partial [Pisolithus marmoratus]
MVSFQRFFRPRLLLCTTSNIKIVVADCARRLLPDPHIENTAVQGLLRLKDSDGFSALCSACKDFRAKSCHDR